MVPIMDQWCSESRYGIKCPYKRIPTRIVVHNTGNGAPGVNEVTYMLNRPEEISFHVAVDDKEIRRAIPFDRNAWASGDGNGTGNMYGIHIEICYSLNGGPRFDKAEENAAEYIATLLISYDWDISKVTKHQDYDGKYCPHRTLDRGWQRFLNMIMKYYNKLNEEADNMSYEQWVAFQQRYEKERAAKEVAVWATDAWDRAVSNGTFDGTAPKDPLTREQAAVVFNRLGLLDK